MSSLSHYSGVCAECSRRACAYRGGLRNREGSIATPTVVLLRTFRIQCTPPSRRSGGARRKVRYCEHDQGTAVRAGHRHAVTALTPSLTTGLTRDAHYTPVDSTYTHLAVFRLIYNRLSASVSSASVISAPLLACLACHGASPPVGLLPQPS